MPEQTGRIVQNLMSEPHIEGRRLSVLNIHDRVEGRGLTPKTVGDRYDLNVADVYRALTYYHDHPGEMKELREERKAAADDVEQLAAEHRPDDVTP